MNLSQAVKKIHPCLVQISIHISYSIDESRTLGRHFDHISLGSGFFINEDGYVVTARHVISKGQELLDLIPHGDKAIHIGLGVENRENIRGSFTLVDFDVIDDDAIHDLMLLRLKINPFLGEVHSGITIGDERIPFLVGIPTFHPDRPTDGASIGISGYPLSSTVLVTNAGWMATSWETEISETPIPGRRQWSREIIISDVYLADVQANLGNSGSPVYLVENASVIGVCIATKPVPVLDENYRVAEILGQNLFVNSGLTQVVPVRYVIELLRKNNLQWKQGP